MTANEEGSPIETPVEPPAPGAAEVRRHMAHLRELAGRLDHQAALVRNGGFNTLAEAQAGRLAGEARAVRWALRQVAPETECVAQTLAALHRAGRGR